MDQIKSDFRWPVGKRKSKHRAAYLQPFESRKLLSALAGSAPGSVELSPVNASNPYLPPGGFQNIGPTIVSVLPPSSTEGASSFMASIAPDLTGVAYSSSPGSSDLRAFKSL